MKIKPFTGNKRCCTGELYKFKKGIANIPGFYLKNKAVTINIKEFLQLNK